MFRNRYKKKTVFTYNLISDSSVPHRGLLAPVRERMREPNHLRDHERTVPRRVRSRAVLPSSAAVGPHQRCVSLLARMPARQEDGAHLRACVLRAPVKVSR